LPYYITETFHKMCSQISIHVLRTTSNVNAVYIQTKFTSLTKQDTIWHEYTAWTMGHMVI